MDTTKISNGFDGGGAAGGNESTLPPSQMDWAANSNGGMTLPGPEPIRTDFRTLNRTSSKSPLATPSSQHSPAKDYMSTVSMSSPPSTPSLGRKRSNVSIRSAGGMSNKALPIRSSPQVSRGGSPRTASASFAPLPQPVPRTAGAVAAEYFVEQLGRHASSPPQTEVSVVLHDLCYGHRYSRPRTSKSTLSMIVERPERIRAAVKGISSAYVRLSLSNRDEKDIIPSKTAEEERPVPFSIRRSARRIPITSSYVTNVHGKKWMEELSSLCDGAAEKLSSTGKELTRTSGSSSTADVGKPKLHEGDLYLCAESKDAFEGALGAVCEGIDNVFATSGPSQTPRAFVCVRPPGHHCSTDYPSGFCWLNNVHVGIEYAAQVYGLTHAVILDFDLHHGDGSQSITWSRNAKSARTKGSPASKKVPIGYFSLHDINSYPCEYGDIEKVQGASLCIEDAHGQSIWNVHLQPWKTEADFWALYESRYRVLLEKAQAFLRRQTERLRNTNGMPPPKAAVFISAGFDASEWEGEGMQRHKVNVPTEFFARFTQDAVQVAKDPTTGCAGRVISVLEGGYSDRALTSGVLSHMCGLCAASRIGSQTSTETSSSVPHPSITPRPVTQDLQSLVYDPSWWDATTLKILEGYVPEPAPFVSTRVRDNSAFSFAAPTTSSTAKAVDPTKVRRSFSGSWKGPPPEASFIVPEDPDVDWTVGIEELTKLLIPDDRPTSSCRVEDLAEAKKPKPKPLPPAETTAISEGGAVRMQLRDRRTKVPATVDALVTDDVLPKKAASKTSRRKTMADVPISTEDAASDTSGPARRRSRRLSATPSLTMEDDLNYSQPAPETAKTTLQLTKPKAATSKARPAAAGTTAASKPAPATRKPKAASRPGAVRAQSASTVTSNGTSASQPSATQQPQSDVNDLASAMQSVSIQDAKAPEAKLGKLVPVSKPRGTSKQRLVLRAPKEDSKENVASPNSNEKMQLSTQPILPISAASTEPTSSFIVKQEPKQDPMAITNVLGTAPEKTAPPQQQNLPEMSNRDEYGRPHSKAAQSVGAENLPPTAASQVSSFPSQEGTMPPPLPTNGNPFPPAPSLTHDVPQTHYQAPQAPQQYSVKPSPSGKLPKFTSSSPIPFALSDTSTNSATDFRSLPSAPPPEPRNPESGAQ